ncbi:hypothetical protein JCM8547_003863 [Rhodosporidiobolus lusitaniae]
MPAPLPPPRSIFSPAPAAPPSPGPSSPSRPSSPSALFASVNGGSSRSKKGDTLSPPALLSDLAVLTSGTGQAALNSKGRSVFEPTPKAEDAYAPAAASVAALTLEDVREGAVKPDDLGRKQARELAELWVGGMAQVLQTAERELGEQGQAGKVSRAERVEGSVGKVARGLRT